MFVGREAGRDRLVGVFVGEFIEREAAALDDFQAAFHRLRMRAEQAGDLRGGFQMAFGVGGECAAGGGDGDLQANAGHHVVQRAAVGRVVEHVVGGDQRHAAAGGEVGERAQAACVVGAEAPGGGEVGAAAEFAAQAVERARQRVIRPVRRDCDQNLTGAEFEQIGEMQRALALAGARLAARQQLRQPAPGGAVGGIAEHIGRAVGEAEAGADQQAQAALFRRLVRTHHAGDGVVVGDADCGEAERGGDRHQFLGVAGAAQEREGGGGLQFGVARGHAACS